MKLQDAFVAEKGVRVGNWKEIGYLMQNSSNFYYCDKVSDCTSGDNSDGYAAKASIADESYTAYWTATSLAVLNDCAKGSDWNLTTAQNGTAGGMVTYSVTGAGATPTGDCGVLTPNFAKLAR